MRQVFGVALVAVVVTSLVGCAPPGDNRPDGTPIQVPDKPSAPVELNLLDGGGMIGVAPMVDAFVKTHPDIISSVTWESASESDTVSTIKPQVESGNIQIDMVVTGTSGMSAGIANDLWVPIATDYADRLSNMDNYIEPAKALQDLTEGTAVNVIWCYCGPVMIYNPAEVSDPPQTPEELLQWASKNPGKFGYSRPANSGVGRTFLLALPYILGDKDPQDPNNGWDKTWAYLEELGKYIDNYPSSTGQSVTNLADGTWSLMPSSVGWDVEPRINGQMPLTMETYNLDKTTWVMDPNYVMVPRGIDPEKLSAILLLIQYMLTPEVNAMTVNGGSYLPGAVVEGATLDLAPQEMQDQISEFTRPWYEDAAATVPLVAPPGTDVVVEALDIWDRRIGAGG